MEELLGNLGVSVESENDVQKAVLRKKIEESIKFDDENDIISFPITNIIPKLSKQYMDILIMELQSEMLNDSTENIDDNLVNHKISFIEQYVAANLDYYSHSDDTSKSLISSELSVTSNNRKREISSDSVYFGNFSNSSKSSTLLNETGPTYKKCYTGNSIMENKNHDRVSHLSIEDSIRLLSSTNNNIQSFRRMQSSSTSSSSYSQHSEISQSSLGLDKVVSSNPSLTNKAESLIANEYLQALNEEAKAEFDARMNNRLDLLQESEEKVEEQEHKDEENSHTISVRRCPLCDKEFSNGFEDEEIMSKHVDRCLRRNHTDASQIDIQSPDPRTSSSSSSRVSKQVHVGGKVLEENKLVEDDWENKDFLHRISSCSEIGDAQDEEEVGEGEGGIDNGDGSRLTWCETGFGTKCYESTWNALHEYQKEGCRWMYKLYQEGVGGILGDEMGLGKTAQLCAHFGSLAELRSRETSMGENSNRDGGGIFLIVAPATVLHHWLNEMHRWCPLMRTVIFHDISPTGSILNKKSEKVIEAAIRRLQLDNTTRNNNTTIHGTGLSIIITYDGLRRHRDSLLRIEWTAICLDEGQKIRNPTTEITSLCKELPSYHRIILSGTPIQNSLRELWSLFDFVYPGRLGFLTTFELEFANPIRAGGYTNASKLQVELAVQSATMLQRMVKPFLLRRRKCDLTDIARLPGKTEQILFCKLSPMQREIYHTIISSQEVQAVLSRRMSAFRAIITLRKLCNHPAMVYRTGKIIWDTKPVPTTTETGKSNNVKIPKNKKSPKNKKTKKSSEKSSKTSKNTKSSKNYQKDQEDSNDDDSDYDDDDDNVVDLRGFDNEEDFECNDDNDDEDGLLSPSSSSSGLEGISWSDSGKLLVLHKVLPLWFSEGHKVLLFSQTQSMLGLIEAMMKEFGYRYMRMDGSTSVSKRSSIVDTFNADPTIFVMLLTTRTGGVGISLTSANRVVLIDPDWNPMVDMQARERAWRIGQERDVVIYRLITRGTIEEKIYQRQIFKVLLSNRILNNPKQKAMFTKTDLKELFELNDEEECPSHMQSQSRASGRTISTVDNDLPEEGEVSLTTQSTKSNNNNNDFGEINANIDTHTHEVVVDDTEGVISGDNKRDKRLLEALFNGEAITGVYNHNYIESYNEHSQVRQYAQRAVESAVQRLQHSNAPSSSALSSSSSCALPRFGAVISSSVTTTQATSSSSILSSIRSQTSSTANNSSSFHIVPPPPPNANTNLTSFATFQNHRNGQDFFSLRDNIKQRLDGLFNDRSLVSSNRLTSEYILSRFHDLSDQHAPVFKEILKSVATLTRGIWIRNNP